MPDSIVVADEAEDTSVAMAQRPLLLRVLPGRLRLSAWSRLYRGRHEGRGPLYSAASLEFAPGVTMQLVAGDVISDAIAFTGIYELSLSRRVSALARHGGTMIEVGANLGYFTLLWAAARKDNRCVSFEASPRNYPLLSANVARNRFEAQVRVVPMAAGASRGVLTFDLGPKDQTGWGGFSGGRCDGAVDVEVVRVDETIGADTRVTLLKIDAEGADTWVLEGCERLLRAGLVREVWYEQNKPRMRALGIPLNAAEAFLKRVGYAAAPDGDPHAPVVEWRAAPRQ